MSVCPLAWTNGTWHNHFWYKKIITGQRAEKEHFSFFTRLLAWLYCFVGGAQYEDRHSFIPSLLSFSFVLDFYNMTHDPVINTIRWCCSEFRVRWIWKMESSEVEWTLFVAEPPLTSFSFFSFRCSTNEPD